MCVSEVGCQSVRRGRQRVLSCTNFESSLNNIFSFWKIYTRNHADCVFPITVAICKQWKHNFAKLQRATFCNLEIKLHYFCTWWQITTAEVFIVMFLLLQSVLHIKLSTHLSIISAKIKILFMKKEKIKSPMMWDECFAVAHSNSNEGDLNTNDAGALQKVFPLKRVLPPPCCNGLVLWCVAGSRSREWLKAKARV